MGKVKTLKDLEKLIDRVHVAQKAYADFSESDVEKIFKAAASAADRARIDLAELAVAEWRFRLLRHVGGKRRGCQAFAVSRRSQISSTM